MLEAAGDGEVEVDDGLGSPVEAEVEVAVVVAEDGAAGLGGADEAGGSTTGEGEALGVGDADGVVDGSGEALGGAGSPVAKA
ncbi:hypothetical protein FHS38_004825 [Streptomyces netropsis]|uniref:Uncharacterized protein n=1 Tax=Streptomyces netropsis TaxID=55404 RepID=A0A7W7PG60_STRNE|nr:hypothetical protein [Streptomyces netropsis]MBB4888754.1 hypothetical protein [Streptomyces netropsis]